MPHLVFGMHCFTVWQFLGMVEKLRKANFSYVICVCPSVRPSVRSNGTTELPLEGYSLNLLFENLWKICRGHSGFTKIAEE